MLADFPILYDNTGRQLQKIIQLRNAAKAMYQERFLEFYTTASLTLSTSGVTSFGGQGEMYLRPDLTNLLGS